MKKGIESLSSRWHFQLPEFGMLLSFLSLVIFSQSDYSDRLLGYLGLAFVSYAIVFGYAVYLWRSGQILSARFIFIWALLFHVVGLFGAPLFEDDYFRYLWDAYHTVHFDSPYGMPPSAYFDPEYSSHNISPKFQAILGQINYPDIPTIYGPTLQYSFLFAYLIAPGEVWPLQFLYSAVDMVLIVLLLKMTSSRLGMIGVMLYAWSPLVFKELVLTAHPDGLAVCLLMAAVYCYQRVLYKWTAVWLAFSVAAKIFAVLFIPFLLLPKGFFRGPLFTLRKLMSFLVPFMVFLLVIVGVYAPLLISSESDMLGLSAMAQNWEFNSALYGVLTVWLDGQYAKLILAGLLCLLLGSYFFVYSHSSKEHLVRGDLIMGVFLLCAPVINPWYLVWVLPFAALHFNPTAWVASMMIVMAYIVGLNLEYVGFIASAHLGPYDQPYWVRIVEFGTILLVALVVVIYRLRLDSFKEYHSVIQRS